MVLVSNQTLANLFPADPSHHLPTKVVPGVWSTLFSIKWGIGEWRLAMDIKPDNSNAILY